MREGGRLKRSVLSGKKQWWGGGGRGRAPSEDTFTEGLTREI